MGWRRTVSWSDLPTACITRGGWYQGLMFVKILSRIALPLVGNVTSWLSGYDFSWESGSWLKSPRRMIPRLEWILLTVSKMLCVTCWTTKTWEQAAYWLYYQHTAKHSGQFLDLCITVKDSCLFNSCWINATKLRHDRRPESFYNSWTFLLWFVRVMVRVLACQLSCRLLHIQCKSGYKHKISGLMQYLYTNFHLITITWKSAPFTRTPIVNKEGPLAGMSVVLWHCWLGVMIQEAHAAHKTSVPLVPKWREENHEEVVKPHSHGKEAISFAAKCEQLQALSV